MPPKNPIQAMRANLAWMRERGASVEEQRAELERWKPVIARFNAAERAPSGVLENVAAGAEELASGATLGLSGLADDAISSQLNPNGPGFAARRQARSATTNAFRDENPLLAPALNIAGAIATPALGAGKAVATGLSMVPRVARAAPVAGLMAEGAAQAGLQGAVTGVDAGTLDAVKRAFTTGARDAAIGGVAAPVFGGAVGGGARLGQRALQRGAASPGVRRLTNELGEAITRMDAPAADLGDDVMPADLLEGGARRVRAYANMSPDAERLAKSRLGDRAARVADRTKGALTRASGLSPEDVAASRRANVERRAAAAGPLYDEALQAGDLMPERVPSVGGRKPKGGLAARDAQGRLRTDFTGVDDKALDDELTRLMEAQSMDEAQVYSLEDTPEFIEYNDTQGSRLREDRRGFMSAGGDQIGDLAQQNAVVKGRVQARAKSIERLQAEIRRRADAGLGEDVPDFLADAGENAGEAAMGLGGLVESPIVQSAIRQAKALPQYRNLPDTDIRVLDKVYKNIGGRLRAAQRSGDNVLAHDLGEIQSALRAEIGERVPRYREAVGVFKGESALNEAYDAGVDVFKANPGDVREAMRGMEPGELEMFRKGVVDRMRQQIGASLPNSHLGEFARRAQSDGQVLVGKDEAVERLTDIFGEQGYRELLRQALREGAYNRTANEVMQNSTTAKQMADMGVFGLLGDDAAASVTTSARGTSANFAGRMLRRGVDKARGAMDREGIREATDLLTRSGADNAEALRRQAREELERRASAKRLGKRVSARTGASVRGLIGER